MSLSNPVLRRRVLVLLAVLGLSGALLTVEYGVGRRVVTQSFSRLEQQAAERNLQQVVKAVESDLDHLAVSVRDYAAWDDAYEYAGDRNERFVRSSLSPDILANLGANVAWLVDPQGRDIISLFHAPGAAPLQIQRPAPANMLAVLRAAQLKIREHGTSARATDRLLQTPYGILAFAAHPIVHTDRSGPERGLLLFARLIGKDVLSRARETSQLPVELFEAQRRPKAALPPPVRNLFGSGQRDARSFRAASESRMDGFALLRDVNGAPAAVLQTYMERDMRAFGAATLHYLTVLMAIAIGLFAVVVAALLLRIEAIWRGRAASERRYRAVITQAQDSMLLADAQGRQIIEANPAAMQILGYEESQLLSMLIDDLFVARDGDTLRPVQPEFYLAASADRAIQVRCRDDRLLDMEVTATTLMIEDREAVSFVLRDVSARKRAERALVDNQRRLSHLAHHDVLTGLFNRLGLETLLPDILDRAEVAGEAVAFFYMDVDHFKKINDLRGHASGDRLLQAVADRLRGAVASSDLIVRMGGDEFVVVATKLKDPEDAAVIARRLREKVSAPFEIDGQEMPVTTSIGVSLFPQDGRDYELLLKNADIALYEAKARGRDTYSLFVSKMNARVSERVGLEHALRAAIRGEQFFLEYQPIVDLATQKLASLEALLRWRDPVRGVIQPGEFIEVAEETGLIADLGDFVLRRICAQLREWLDLNIDVVPIAFNVSSRQIERQDMLSVITAATGEAWIDPKLLHFELTESALMAGHERHTPVLTRLRELGLKVSVDDFGTGYSSLSYLKHLPIDHLKIDRAFVRDLCASANGDAIVTAIIHMAASLGLGTIAEGIESLEQLRRLRELGATMGQGFYFSRPLSAEACLRLLTESARRLSYTETLRLRTIGQSVA